MKAKTTPMSVRITDNERAAIETAIRMGQAINSADYLRQALREKTMRDEGRRYQ